MEWYENLIFKINYFVERKCTPSWNLQRKEIDFHDLTYVVSGKAIYIIDGISYAVEKGDILYAPERCFREAYTDRENPMHCFAFNFHIKNLKDENVVLPLNRVSKIGMDEELITLYRDFNNTWLEKGPMFMLKCHGLFMVILQRLLVRAETGSVIVFDKRIEKIKDYILRHYHEKIDIDMLSSMAGLHSVYLGAHFKKVTGYSIRRYINLIRINKARDLLSTGGYSVGEAAYRCGFEDIFYFSKLFKEIVGMAPSRFIK